MLFRVKKEENGEEEEKKPKLDSQEVYIQQNKNIYLYRDFLKTLGRKELHLLLEFNGQQIPVGIETVSSFSDVYKPSDFKIKRLYWFVFLIL